MNTLMRSRIGRTGIAFALVGVAALCLSLVTSSPRRPGGSGATIGALCFIVVGVAMLAVGSYRGRRR